MARPEQGPSRSFADAQKAACAQLVINGVYESLALVHGAQAPLIDRVTLAIQGTWPEGGEVEGVLSYGFDGEDLSVDSTIAMLAKAMTLMTIGARPTPLLEEDDDDGTA